VFSPCALLDGATVSLDADKDAMTVHTRAPAPVLELAVTAFARRTRRARGIHHPQHRQEREQAQQDASTFSDRANITVVSDLRNS
jgi:hypothetical protein